MKKSGIFSEEFGDSEVQNILSWQIFRIEQVVGIALENVDGRLRQVADPSE